MKKTCALLFLVLLWAGLAQAAPAKVGETLPDLEIKGAVSAKAAAYLGLPQGKAGFRLSEIKATFVLIEIFSMYCPYCQGEAPQVNRLHALLTKSPQARTIRLIGIGAGNSDFEIEYFRDTYAVTFPLFPDGDFRVHKAVGQVGTPTFILVSSAPQAGKLKVLLFQEGVFTTPEAFLGQVLKKAGLK